MFKSRNISQELRIQESEPLLLTQQRAVYQFKCDQCEAGYVACTCRHIYQLKYEHKRSMIGKHMQKQH